MNERSVIFCFFSTFTIFQTYFHINLKCYLLIIDEKCYYGTNYEHIRRKEVFLFLLIIISAFASGGASSDDGESMIFLLSVILMLVAYILTRCCCKTRRDFCLFLDLNILLGLGLSLRLSILTTKNLPVLILSVGYFGWYEVFMVVSKVLLVWKSFRLAIIESLFTLVFNDLLSVPGLLKYIPNLQPNENWYVGVMLGCSAIGGSTSVSELLQDTFPHVKSSIYTVIFQSTKISNIIAIFTFGSLVCMSYSFHSSDAMSTPSVMGWVTLGLGLGLGLLFSMFLDKTSDENSDFLAVTGITCLTLVLLHFLICCYYCHVFLGNHTFLREKASDLFGTRTFSATNETSLTYIPEPFFSH